MFFPQPEDAPLSPRVRDSYHGHQPLLAETMQRMYPPRQPVVGVLEGNSPSRDHSRRCGGETGGSHGKTPGTNRQVGRASIIVYEKELADNSIGLVQWHVTSSTKLLAALPGY